MKVYTKTGDQGTTSLVGGKRISKSHPRIEAYGTIDELSAQVALLRDMILSKCTDSPHAKNLLSVLDHLMRLGAHLASETGTEKYLPEFGEQQVHFLESCIDTIEGELTPIKKFTLPGGDPLISQSHVARTTCRRSERRIIELNEQSAVEEEIMRYINRLSDYLYVLGRKLGEELKINELLWEY